MKRLRYDRHAQRRMKWRKISFEEVEMILNDPDKKEFTEKGRINVFKSIKERYIKVTYKELEDEILIISAVDKRD